MPAPTPVQAYFDTNDPLDDVTLQTPLLLFYGPALKPKGVGFLVFLKLFLKLYRGNGPDVPADEMSLSLEELGAFMRVGSDNTVTKYTTLLIDLGFLVKVKAQTSYKQQATNRYQLTVPDFNPPPDLIEKYWPKGWVPPELPYTIKPFKNCPAKNAERPSNSAEQGTTGGASNFAEPGILASQKMRGSKEVISAKKLLLQTRKPEYDTAKAALIERFRKVEKPGNNLFGNPDLEPFVEVAAGRATSADQVLEILSAKLSVVEASKAPRNPRGLWYKAIINDFQPPPPPASEPRRSARPVAPRKHPVSSPLEDENATDFKDHDETQITKSFDDLVATGAPASFIADVLLNACYAKNPLWPALKKRFLKGGDKGKG